MADFRGFCAGGHLAVLKMLSLRARLMEFGRSSDKYSGEGTNERLVAIGDGTLNPFNGIENKQCKSPNYALDKHNTSGLDSKTSKIKQIVEDAISPDSKQAVIRILDQVNELSTAEKLLLYLKLPTGSSSKVDPLLQPLNPLGSRFEIHQTITWIKTHLEEDPDVSLPKQDVYNEYIAYCNNNAMKALSTADFGKVMKQVFPCVRPRRLGTRGNSRYCYAGMRKKIKLEAPRLPDLGEVTKLNSGSRSEDELLSAASYLICEWAQKMLGVTFKSLHDLACHLVMNLCVDSRSVAAFTVLSASLVYRPLNPLGCRLETLQTITWIKRHLEEDPDVSLPKQDVYNEYIAYCNNNAVKALSTADFGKVMKEVFHCVRPRRLGTRGNSRYCYAGVRKKIKLEAPLLPDLGEVTKLNSGSRSEDELLSAASCLICEWAQKLLGVTFKSLHDLACHLVENLCVDSHSVAAFTVLSANSGNKSVPSLTPSKLCGGKRLLCS